MDNSTSQIAEPSKIRWLINKTSEDWIDLAISNPMEILLDHAHCERKAAGVALQLMFRYVSEPGLSEALSPLAREELEHFERVLSILNARGKNLQLFNLFDHIPRFNQSIFKLLSETIKFWVF